MVIADQRSTFRHTITDREREFDLIKKIRHLLIHGRSSHNHFTKTSAEGINQFLPYLCIDTGIQQWNIQRHLHSRLAKLRQDHFLVNLLQDQRDRQDQVRFHLLEGFQQDFGRRNLPQQVDMRPDSHRNQEIERTTISMCQRQKTEFAFPPVQYAKLDAVHHIPRQVVSGKHNPFTETGRAGSIVQQDHFVIVQFRIFDIILAETVRILFRHLLIHAFQKLLNAFTIALMQATEIGQRKDTTHVLDHFLFQCIPDTVTDKKENRLGVIDNMMHIVRTEVLQDRYYNRSVGHSGHINNTPAGTVFSDQSNLISPPYLTFFK